MADETVRVLSQYMFTVLEEPLALLDGEVIPAGTTVMFAPQTTAHSVRVPGSRSLLEAWDSLSKEGHAHTGMQALLSKCQTELIVTTDRLTRLEIWAAQNGYNAAKTAQE